MPGPQQAAGFIKESMMISARLPLIADVLNSRILPVLALFFCFAFFSSPATAEVVVDRVVALVNNEPITHSDVLKEAENETVEIIKELQGQDREQAINSLQKRVLQDLVEKKLQLQEAVRLGIGTSDAEVNDAITDMKKQMGLDDNGLRQMIAAQKMTQEEFRTQLRDFLTIVKLVEQEVNSRIVVTQEEIQAYFNAHKDEFKVEEGTRVQQIFLNLTILGGSDAVAQVMAKMMDIQQRLKKGESFESLATKHSQDPSAEHGGDMGVFKKGQLMPALDKVVFQLKEGEVSEPIWSENGVHIVKVVKIETGRNRPFEEVKGQIENRLKNEQMEKVFSKFIAELKNKAYIEIRM